MRFVDTIRPLVIAPAATVLVVALFEAFNGKSGRAGFGFLLGMAWIWLLSLGAAAIFVLPVLALVPRLRKPALWLAALWGARYGTFPARRTQPRPGYAKGARR